MALSEFDIIKNYFAPRARTTEQITVGLGDDAAVIQPPTDMRFALSLDTVLAGVHFPNSARAEDAGYKSLAVSISDLAAMGAKPFAVLMALTIPHADEVWLEGFCKGFFELVDQYQLELLGGDLTKGAVSITVQIIGLLPKNKALLRTGAKVGDLVYVSGKLGAAALALRLLSKSIGVPEQHEEECFQRLYRPPSRIELGIQLLDIATSAIDISDGLLSELEHISNASGVGIRIDAEKIPIADPVIMNIRREAAYQMILTTGDDYELCFTVPPALRDKVEALSEPVTCIGEVIAEPGVSVYTKGELLVIEQFGYQHF